MIFVNCSCGTPVTIGWEAGDGPGYYKTVCPCGKILMTELSSFAGETTVMDTKEELEEFIKEKNLNVPKS